MKGTKAIVAGVIGIALEYYDVMLYMHFLPILSPLFFPSEDPAVATLLGMLSFAIGFCVRPLGGLLFGHIGDRYGRKVALGITIMIMGAPTFAIGLLPVYAQVGVAASIALILCRVLQSFSVAGESIGGCVFLVEHAPPGHECLVTCLSNVAVQIGSFVGAGLGLLCLYSFFPEWGWRVPFLCGALFGFFGYYIRRRIAETPAFVKLRQQKRVLKLPLLETIKRDKISILRTIGICAGVMAPCQVIYTYMAEVLRTKFQFLPDQVIAHNMKLMVLMGVFMLPMGYLADRFGCKRIMGISLLGAIFLSYPSFLVIQNAESAFQLIMMQSVLVVLNCGVTAPCIVLVSQLFPTRERFSGYALGWNLGAVLFSGFVPVISLLLVQWTGDQKAPSYILMFCGLLGLSALLSFKEFKGLFLSTETRSSPQAS